MRRRDNDTIVRMPVIGHGQLEGYLSDNPRGKHGRMVYDLQGDFGVAPAAVRDRFAFYFDRFAVRVEA